MAGDRQGYGAGLGQTHIRWDAMLDGPRSDGTGTDDVVVVT